MKQKILLSITFLLIAFYSNAQQNIQFSQYVFNGLAVNPAYAGYKGDWYANATYRQQWTGFPGAPKTGSASIDGLLNTRNDNMGLGVQVLYDKLGPQSANSIYGSYSYRIQMDEADTKRLCLGLAVGLNAYTLDGTMLDPIDNTEAELPKIKSSTYTPDANFGIYYYTPKYYIGASVMDLFSLNSDRVLKYKGGNEIVSIKKAMHLYLTAGMLMDLSENVKLKPSFMLKEDFKGPTALDINIFALLGERLWIGGSYRTTANLWKKQYANGQNLNASAAASFMAEFFATEKLRIGYSYDMATNALAGYQGGSHELSIGYALPSRRQNRIVSPRYF